MLVLHDSELIDRKPVVVLRIVEVDDANLRPADRAVAGAIFNCRAIHQQTVKSTIARLEGCALGVDDLAECVLVSLGRQDRVQPRERLLEAALKNSLVIVLSLGRELARCDLRTMLDLPAQALEPGESGGLDDGLSESLAHALVWVSWMFFSVWPSVVFHSTRPFEDLPSRTPAAVEGEEKV